MNKALHFIGAFILFMVSLAVAVSIMFLVVAFGGTERWDGYTGQEKPLQAAAEMTGGQSAGTYGNASSENVKTARQAKPLATWPPEEADVRPPQE